MKFVTYMFNKKVFPGVLNKEESRVYSLDEVFGVGRFNSILDFIESSKDEDIYKIGTSLEKDKLIGRDVRDVVLLSPIPKPIHDIICVGINYKDHIEESQSVVNNKQFKKVIEPVFFSKRAHKIIASDENIKGAFKLDGEIDYEVELAVIIGKKGKNISKDKVEDYIFGYSIFNDLSSRKLQRDRIQWYKGKSLDGYSVMGPSIIHKSKLPFPIKVDISSKVNGQIRQKSNTSLLINDISTIVSDFSKGITLEPGDIISTGTPAGVGMGFTPPKFLTRGDVVECEIPEIGILKNKII